MDFLRHCELRLLRCSLCPSFVSASKLVSYDSEINTHYKSVISCLISSIEAGDYFGALNAEEIRTFLNSSEPSGPDFSCFIDGPFCPEFLNQLDSLILQESDESIFGLRVMAFFSVAVAALLWFTQCNLTGPPVTRISMNAIGVKDDESIDWHKWAYDQLIVSGVDINGNFSAMQFIVVAKIILSKIRELLFRGLLHHIWSINSICWWLARAMFLHQKILDEHSSSLSDELHNLMHETMRCFGTVEEITSYWGAQLQDGEAAEIATAIHLEAAVVDKFYARTESCRKHLEIAVNTTGLHLYLRGVLGFRTAHQVEPKAQMVLVANDIQPGDKIHLKTKDGNAHLGREPYHEPRGQSEGSNILMTPQLLGNDPSETLQKENKSESSFVSCLSDIQQVVVLSQCLLFDKSPNHDEMIGWEMAPYIEAVCSQAASLPAVRRYCDLLRIRWESTRSQTKERALLMMDCLVQDVLRTSPDVAQRIPLCFGVLFPTTPALRKEYGELLVHCGLIGEALRIFEHLKLWDNVILCYRLIGKKAAATVLLKNRLTKSPNDPKLWCSLGDVTGDDTCYKKAMQISNSQSARAMRSLARIAYDRGDYMESKNYWESAMAMNSLFPDGWFALGAASLKARDVKRALEAFTLAVQLDPDNGEAWNNIACLHLLNKKSKEAFVAFKEALKFKRDSWQMWENYSYVAIDVDNIVQALDATVKVMDITGNERINFDVLRRVLTLMEQQSHAEHSDQAPSIDNNHGKSKELGYAMELLEKILQRIAQADGSADAWDLVARWHKIRGDLTMCAEALLKQIRAFMGSDLWRDKQRFRKFAHVSLELCEVYMQLSSTSGSHKELFAAEMHLKNAIKQGECFSNTKEHVDLQSMLGKVNAKLQSDNV